MPWARLDDGFHDHPKVDGLSLAAVGVYTLCLTWAHRHRRTAIIPGHITEARVTKIAGRQARALAAELVTAQLWEVEPNIGGWVIHDFTDYLPKERDPDERKEAGKKGAAKRWEGHGKPDGKLPSSSMASDSSRASAPAFPSRPVPEVPTQEGGERAETLRIVPATSPLEEADEVCSRHPDGNPTNEACRGCQRVEERRQKRAERAAERERLAAEKAARDCTRCDGTWEVDDQLRPTRRRCAHSRRSA